MLYSQGSGLQRGDDVAGMVDALATSADVAPRVALTLNPGQGTRLLTGRALTLTAIFEGPTSRYSQGRGVKGLLVLFCPAVLP